MSLRVPSGLLPALALPLALVLVVSGCATPGPSAAPPTPDAEPLVIPTVPPRPSDPAREPAPDVRAGERVAAIRLAQDPIRLQVGESVGLEALNPTPVDGEGNPVPEARLLVAPLQGRVAVFRDGRITALEEGETRLMLAVLAPGAAGRPEPRLFPRPILVTGPPVARLEVVPPALTLYTGTALPFQVRALDSRGEPRRRVEVSWSSRNPEIASVGRDGLVRGHRPGRAALQVSSEGVELTHVVEVRPNPVRSIELDPSAASVRTGDVLRFRARALDGAGREVTDVPLTWATAGRDPGAGAEAVAWGDGTFVAEGTGSHRVVVATGGIAAEALVDARPRSGRLRAEARGVALLPHHPASEVEVFRGRDGRDYAYLGTHAGGARLMVWDVTDPSHPVLADSVRLRGRGVHDLRVTEDASLAVVAEVTAEGEGGAVVVLDLEHPRTPRILARLDRGFRGQVGRLALTGRLLYAVEGETGSVRILDLRDPGGPREVGRWGLDGPGLELRDFRVTEGLAVAAFGDHGVRLLDLGGGGAGGTPEAPVLLASWAPPHLHAQVAALQRRGGGGMRLLVGDAGPGGGMGAPDAEAGGDAGALRILTLEAAPDGGGIHPREEARYHLPGAQVRDLLPMGDRLLVAYGEAGLRVVDLSGELRGELRRQGRELARFSTGHPGGFTPNLPMTRSVRVHRGHIFLSDLHSGLWTVRLLPDDDPGIPGSPGGDR